MAIVATKGHLAHSAVSFFEASQESNGTFGVYGIAGHGQQGDPDSTAYVIQALLALRATTILGSYATASPSNKPWPASSSAAKLLQANAASSPTPVCRISWPPCRQFLLRQVFTPRSPAARCRSLSPVSAAVHPELRSAVAVAVLVAAVVAVTSISAIVGATSPAAASLAGHSRHNSETCALPAHLSKGEIVVPVVVDFGATKADVLVTCVVARAGDTGADVLAAQATLLGYPPPRYAESGLLCAIDGYPKTGCGTFSGAHYAYWAYWHGGSRWTYANDGPGEETVSKGDVQGWRYEPRGTASPSDPPPRASSAAASLETSAGSAQSSSAITTRPVHRSDGTGGTRVVLFAGCIALILLIGVATLQRSRRASRHPT